MSSTNSTSEHVGELLSGYVDGELTQQQRQRVDVHCEDCGTCRDELDGIAALRDQVRGAPLGMQDDDLWRERSVDATASIARTTGWFLIVAGVLVATGLGVYHFVMDPNFELLPKIAVATVYLGGALLLLSVLRQRLIERKTDKFKDVEI